MPLAERVRQTSHCAASKRGPTNREEKNQFALKEANVASPLLPSSPFIEALRFFGACLCVAAMLVLAAVPFIIISYEQWKQRVR